MKSLSEGGLVSRWGVSAMAKRPTLRLTTSRTDRAQDMHICFKRSQLELHSSRTARGERCAA
eukprot:4192401-Alexandrium_andersonii.AAC.1